jgi:hypothetical protein
MIEQVNIHQGRGLLKLSRDLYIGLAGLEISGRVVMA